MFTPYFEKLIYRAIDKIFAREEHERHEAPPAPPSEQEPTVTVTPTTSEEFRAHKMFLYTLRPTPSAERPNDTLIDILEGPHIAGSWNTFDGFSILETREGRKLATLERSAQRLLADKCAQLHYFQTILNKHENSKPTPS